MQATSDINCSGLNAASAYLRIKQALLTGDHDRFPISVMVDSECDCGNLEASLGALQPKVRFVTRAPVTAVNASRSSTTNSSETHV